MERLASFAVFLGMALGVFVVGANGLMFAFWLSTSKIDDAGLYPLDVITWTGVRVGAVLWAITVAGLLITAVASLVKPQLYRLRSLFAVEPY